MVRKDVKIEEPAGKLGVLIPGLGAVSTTFIAGVEAVKKNIAKPIGSLTQMGTIRLGKRTDKRVPAIKDFVPLANIQDLVFGGWDIYNDNCFQSASNAGVLEKSGADAEAYAKEVVLADFEEAGDGDVLRKVTKDLQAKGVTEQQIRAQMTELLAQAVEQIKKSG